MGNYPSLPDKNPHYYMKEHFAEDYPVWTQDGFEIVKLKVDDLFTSDQEELRQIGKRIVEGLSSDHVIIIQNSPIFSEKVKAALEESKKFLSQSQEMKEASGAPEKVNGKRSFYSGYSLIYFDNRDNKRDKEWRDVFEIRYGEEGHIPWPSTEFETAARQVYESQWSICVQAMHAIALALNIDPLALLAIAVGEGKTKDDLNSSGNTNLCFFHYYDKFMSYTAPQKCMVHKDRGLLTLLPKTDLPGLELLHPRLNQWIPIEQFIDDNDVLLYCGEALATITDSKVVPATHRVVRLPLKERYSMPFELKPNEDALLRNLVNPANEPNPITFGALTKRYQWERVMKLVNRSDGIEPTAEDETPQNDTDGKPAFEQPHHDVQLPSVSVK